MQNFLNLPGQGAGAAAGIGAAVGASQLPARPEGGLTRPGQLPSPGERPSIGQLPAPGERPGAGGGRPGPGGERPGIGEGNRPGPGNRPVEGSWQGRWDHRQQVGNHIRDHYRHHPYPGFRPGWWTHHPHPHWPIYGPGRPAGYWWRWATWPAMTAWVTSWAWGPPIYYDYGAGGNVYYENNTVYVDGQPACSADQYAQQATEIAENVPQVDPEQAEWMPLGVFALTQESGGDPTMYVQLAVSKEGIIAGTYENTVSGSVQPLEGSVDSQTQRAAWTIVDKKTPVMETGIYNLTQDQAPALVHFSDGSTQQWLMVRMNPPEEDAQAAP